MRAWSNWFWLAAIAYVVGCMLWRRSRQWLLHYLWGSLGLTLLLVYPTLASGLGTRIAQMEMLHAQWVVSPWVDARALDVCTLVVPDATGWSILLVGIECSAVLETACLLGLTLFYPRFGVRQRSLVAAGGVASTYVLNIIRLAVIILITHFAGKRAVVIAHAVAGRLVFFVGVIAIYWYLITRSTLTMIARDVSERRHA